MKSSNNSASFSGSIVAIVTPMKRHGEIDYMALKELVEWHISAGTKAIVAVGTTGESPVLNVKEHLSVVEAVIEQVDGRLAVIAGNGSNATNEAIHLTREVAKMAVDACLCVTPYYNKPTQEGLFQHFKAIAEAENNMPQILYNVPGRTGVDLLPQTVERLSHIENIVALKEATGSLTRLRELLALLDDKFILLSGDDASCREFMLQGGDGVISVTANVAPEKMSRMCGFALSGNESAAAKIDSQLLALHRELFIEANPIPVKWALAKMKRIGSGIRLPLTELDNQYHSLILQALAKADIE